MLAGLELFIKGTLHPHLRIPILRRLAWEISYLSTQAGFVDIEAFRMHD
jgi:hypothetical protein